MARKTEVTNPAYARTKLPRQRGRFGSPAPVEPISAKPRNRVGERFTDGRSVEVTNEHPRAQQQRQGEF